MFMRNNSDLPVTSLVQRCLPWVPHWSCFLVQQLMSTGLLFGTSGRLESILRKQKHGCFLKWWDIPPNNPILIGFSIILTIHFGVFLYFRKTQFLRKSLMSNVIVFHHLDSPQLGFATLRCWWKAGEPNVWPPKRWDLMVMNPMGSQSVKKSSKKQMQA